MRHLIFKAKSHTDMLWGQIYNIRSSWNLSVVYRPLRKQTPNFTFMLPCIVIDFFLNNQQDALIIQSRVRMELPSVVTLLGSCHQKPA